MIFMISVRYAVPCAGMLFASSEAVENIGQKMRADMQDACPRNRETEWFRKKEMFPLSGGGVLMI